MQKEDEEDEEEKEKMPCRGLWFHRGTLLPHRTVPAVRVGTITVWYKSEVQMRNALVSPGRSDWVVLTDLDTLASDDIDRFGPIGHPNV
ncbi:hypothetical protein Dda_3789 [Drechslerella dactyloides]|uniref:Uncharacterized protein n=1 Tax=Drechslerella dactyloides TaxID=74499 RepID=A0AAD6J036_DREDA|nr:hypothetical protein Dda_3789 [Drechslerella dactyloides]